MAARDDPPPKGNVIITGALSDHLHNSRFAKICDAVEAAMDSHARSTHTQTRTSIVSQTDDMCKLLCENVVELDSAALLTLRRVIPNDQYHFIEVVRPSVSEHVAMPCKPVAIAIQFGVSRPPQPSVVEEPTQQLPTIVVRNLRKVGVPDNMDAIIQRMLVKLSTGHGSNVMIPTNNVSYAAKTNVLIITDPPTYSHDFLMSLFTDFSGVLEDFRYEFVDTPGPTSYFLALYLRVASRPEPVGDKYIRTSAVRTKRSGWLSWLG